MHKLAKKSPKEKKSPKGDLVFHPDIAVRQTDRRTLVHLKSLSRLKIYNIYLPLKSYGVGGWWRLSIFFVNQRNWTINIVTKIKKMFGIIIKKMILTRDRRHNRTGGSLPAVMILRRSCHILTGQGQGRLGAGAVGTGDGRVGRTEPGSQTFWMTGGSLLLLKVRIKPGSQTFHLRKGRGRFPLARRSCSPGHGQSFHDDLVTTSTTVGSIDGLLLLGSIFSDRILNY